MVQQRDYVGRHINVLYDSLTRRFEALKPHFEKHRFRPRDINFLSVFESCNEVAPPLWPPSTLT